MKQVWFIRHGESEGNAGLPHAISALTPLTEKGKQQADAIPPRIVERPDLIIVSPFPRAQQTATPTLQKFPDVPTEIWDQVCEFMVLSDTTHGDKVGHFRTRAADQWWHRCDPDYCEAEGMETWRSLIRRVRTVRQRLAALPHDFIVVFTHGTFTRTLVWDTVQGSPVITRVAMRRAREFTRPHGLQFHNGDIIPALVSSDGKWFIGGVEHAE